MVEVDDIRDRLSLKQLDDEEIDIHLSRAKSDFNNAIFDDEFDEKEAVACKTIYYLSPILWLKIQQRANEYDETLQTFEDVDRFQAYWLGRSNSISYKEEVEEYQNSMIAGNIGIGVA